jgi:hypothetical protein
LSFLGLVASSAVGQIQIEMKFPRLQYVAYEPIVANVTLTNLAGRDVDLRDNGSQPWFGFEVTDSESRSISQISGTDNEPLRVATGQRVTRKINLTRLYGVHDFGTYRVRAHVYLADLNKFFYSPTKVFEVADARPIWQRTVGVPQEEAVRGSARTYSLMTNRFSDHTSLYVRVEDRDRGLVYATYSLGPVIAFDQPQAEFDHSNQLHILYCAAPRIWSYARVGLNGQLVSRASFAETKSRPRLVHSNDGVIKVAGGIMNRPITPATSNEAAKLSAGPSNASTED